MSESRLRDEWRSQWRVTVRKQNLGCRWRVMLRWTQQGGQRTKGDETGKRMNRKYMPFGGRKWAAVWAISQPLRPLLLLPPSWRCEQSNTRDQHPIPRRRVEPKRPAHRPAAWAEFEHETYSAARLNRQTHAANDSVSPARPGHVAQTVSSQRRLIRVVLTFSAS